MKIDYKKLVASIVVCEFVGVLGSVFTTSSVSTWYSTLQKPPLTPPSWIFAPVWTTLFLLMGVSLYFVWIKKKSLKTLEMKIFYLQLGLNFFWSVLFFGLRNPLLGLIEMLVLLISILAAIFAFYRVEKKSAALLVPYVLWILAAFYLNYGIWVLN